MQKRRLGFALTVSMLAVAAVTFTFIGQAAGPSSGPYKVLRTIKVGGTGGYDYTNSDVAGRRLYFARTGETPRIGVYNLDTLELVAEIKSTNAHGAVIDPKSNHGFASSKPILMFDSKTNMPIKTIEVMGNPDGMYYDPSDSRVYVLSHQIPYITVINGKDGTVVGTVDIGGMPEQAVGDGKGHLYVDVEDKENVAVIDTKTLMVTAHYDVTGKAATCAGLALDAKNRILFVTCRMPTTMLIMSADTGKIITQLPIGANSYTALFNPKTMEAFSSNVDGTLNVIKEKNPTTFEVEQTVTTMPGARTSTLDTKTGRILLIAAESGPPTPPKEPGGRAGRGPLIPGTFSIIDVGK